MTTQSGSSCTLPTYLSWGIEGDDGPWVERAECDGPQPCGWSTVLEDSPEPRAGGINSQEFATLDAEHRAFARTDSQASS